MHLNGLEIDPELVELARTNLKAAGLEAEFVVGDITSPPALPRFDWALCLNNTLGYIPDEQGAIENMKRLGERIVVSVYGQRFDEDLARQYFGAIGLAEFGGVRRYKLADLRGWGGGVTETPIGYWVEM